MPGWVGNIEEAASSSPFFRNVLFTAPHMQLVLMTLQPGEEIGLEIHHHVDQFILVESGHATLTMSRAVGEVSVTHDLGVGRAVLVPGGTWHNVVNSGDGQLRLLTVYAPPQHPDGTLHKTKADADSAERH